MNDGKLLVKVGQLAKLAGILPSKVRYMFKRDFLIQSIGLGEAITFSMNLKHWIG